MTLQIAVFHRLNDPNDPARHGCPQEDEFQKAILERSQEWIGHQDAVHQARFCEHGSYVGYQRALAHLCPKCPEA